MRYQRKINPKKTDEFSDDYVAGWMHCAIAIAALMIVVGVLA